MNKIYLNKLCKFVTITYNNGASGCVGGKITASGCVDGIITASLFLLFDCLSLLF
jgi:hypothetical protein